MLHRLFTAFGLIALLVRGQDSTQAVLAIQAAIQANDLTSASQLLEKSLASHPNNGGLLNLRGVVHAKRNEMAEARADFEEAVRFSPQLTPAWQNLARACQQLEQATCAVNAWQHVLRNQAGNEEAHSSLARIYLDQQNFAGALRQLDAAKSDDMELRCLAFSGVGRMAEAKAVAMQLAKQSGFSEADLQQMYRPLEKAKATEVIAALVEGLDKRAGAGLVSLQRLALAYEHLERYSEARQTLERVAQLDPNNTAHLLELARLAEASKDHEAALGYLAHARDLAPDMARIHFLFGLIAGELNLPIEAKQSLDKALAIEPDNPEYNYAMGSVILTTRDAATAGTYFAKFVRARPQDSRGRFALGLAQFASGDYAAAKQEMIIARSGRETAPAAEYYLGRIARLQGDLDEATRRLRSALGMRPKFAEPHIELARIALLRSDPAVAHSELQRALQLAPDSFQANEQLLVVYKKTHDARATAQAELLKNLDEERSKRAELMLRTLEMRP